jgi:hypothetical protein
MKAPDVLSQNPAASARTKSKSALENRLASYGVMSLAIAAATAGSTQPAYAGIVQQPLSTSATGQSFFSMGGNAAPAFFTAADFGLIQTSSRAFVAAFAGRAFLAGMANGVRIPALLHFGTHIGTAGQILGTGPGGLQFVTANQTLASANGNGFWFPASNRNQLGYLGLMFDIGGSPHYGWAAISVGADYNITLRSFYGNLNSSSPVAAGAVPEPSSALLLALGAAGLAAYRQKRKTISNP